MSRQHQESLKTQLIVAMEGRFGHELAKSVFEHDLWPVLDAAMTAGELLVARNTIPQKPVHEAITIWLEATCVVIKAMLQDEYTVSRAELIKAMYQLLDGAQRALVEAQSVKEKGLPPEDRNPIFSSIQQS